MNEKWKAIQEDYEKARFYLYPQKGKGYWARNDQKGHYYMWKAYHFACEEEQKEDLVYARILSLMARESRIRESDYDCYHRYIKPAKEAYDRSVESDKKPSDREIERCNNYYNDLKYRLEQHKVPYEDILKCISGSEKLDDFEFHDSKPVWFEHTEEHARLKLRNYDTEVTFLFEELYDVSINTDPMTDWVYDIECYPLYGCDDRFCFDIGFYTIVCSKISVESVVTTNENVE